MGLVKKTKFDGKIRVYMRHFFVLFTHNTTNIDLPRKLVMHTENVEMYTRNFCLEIFHIFKYIFLNKGSICTLDFTRSARELDYLIDESLPHQAARKETNIYLHIQDRPTCQESQQLK
jgi:hypothetical protein